MIQSQTENKVGLRRFRKKCEGIGKDSSYFAFLRPSSKARILKVGSSSQQSPNLHRGMHLMNLLYQGRPHPRSPYRKSFY